MNQDYAISPTATEGDFVFLADIPVNAPQSDWKPYSKLQSLGDGGVRRAGWPIVTWYWAAITEDERAALQAYCADAYADDIYINTLDHNNVWVTARTKIFWMQGTEQWAVDKNLGFTLSFKVKSFEEITGGV